MTRTRWAGLALVLAAALGLAACGESGSVGSLEGDQGAGSGLDPGAVCDRFDAVVDDASLGDDEVRDRLDDLADDAIDDDLAEQVRSAADAVGDEGTDGLDPPRRCEGDS